MGKIKIYRTQKEDLARIVAQMTSGGIGAIPEEADYELADEVIEFIENKLKED